MTEEELRKLIEEREARERDYSELKGYFEGLRLGRESNKELENRLKVLELMMKGFKRLLDYITSLSEKQFNMSQKIINLEREVNQLRETLDKFSEWK